LLFLGLGCTFFCCLGQKEIQITGVVKDSLGNTLPYIDVLLKKKDSTHTLVAFSITDNSGAYSITHVTDQNVLVLETSSLVHAKQSKRLNILGNNQRIFQDFVLTSRIEELEEVEVTATSRIQVRNDTTFFNFEEFTNGTERVVEEILAKLPGIEIDQSGKIKFKGKEVVNVLLDGDNLFNGNYTVGTKNINAKHIEGVEAIENFEDNPLLQGLSKNDEVALNLKFGDGLLLSGDVELAYAEKNRSAANIKAIAITKKTKGFVIASHNAMGSRTSNQLFEVADYIRGAIDEINAKVFPAYITDSKNILPKGNVIANNQLFGSVNVLPKLSKTETLRFNIDMLSDRIRNQISSTTLFGNGTENVIQIDQSNNDRITPFFVSSNLMYQKYFSAKSAWRTDIQLSKIRSAKESISIRNDQEQLEDIVFQEFFLNGESKYTHRINDTSAFTVAGQFLFDERPENLNLTFDGSLFGNPVEDNPDYGQQVYSKKNHTELVAEYYKRGEKSRLGVKAGVTRFENVLESELTENSANLFANTTKYRVVLPEMLLDYLYEGKSLRIRPKFKIKLFDYNYVEASDPIAKNSTILVDGYLTFEYELNKKNVFFLEFNHVNELPNEENLYANFILRPNRLLQNNALNFDRIASNTASISYNYSSLNKNTIFRLGFDYEKKENDYIIANNVDGNTAVVTNFLQNNASEKRIFNLAMVKYVDFLRSTFRINATYENSSYFNFFNGPNLRFNKGENLNSSLSIGTSFIGKFLFGNTLTYSNSNFRSEGFEGIGNQFLANTFNLSYVFSERLRFDAFYKYTLPNINATNSTSSIDASIKFKNKKKTISYGVEARNILNQSNLQRVNNTDFFTTLTSESLFDRIILFSVNFKF